MSENDLCFVEWKEEFVSQERGNRVVHYFLKDSAGDSVLAIVGTERSVRHMFYVIADEFLLAYGDGNSVHAGFKWRSRREVVDWLTSMLSKQHLGGSRSELATCESMKALGFPEYAMNGISAQHTKAPDNLNLRGRSSEIVWSGSPWMCGKQLKHFPSFCRNGITILVQSFVFVMAKGDGHYVAYLEDMYEDKKGLKKVKARWFHHNKEVKGVFSLRNHHPKEVFITPYSQVISAECVDGVATVLNKEHFEQCSAAIPHGFLVKVHMCHRQFRNNRIKPFDMSKLQGYFNQPILSCLSWEEEEEEEEEEEDDEMGRGGSVKCGAKRARSANDLSRVKRSGKERHVISCGGPYENLSYGSSKKRLLSSLKHISHNHWFTEEFKVDDKIELLCQDSGIRGCWFRCTVLQVLRKQIKVKYDDLQDEDECGNLEEWIPAFKPAIPDKLGMRHSDRPTLRPTPPREMTELSFEVGAAIDSWWSDGWWEGIITGVENATDNLQVFFPGESLLLAIDKKDVRISRDWLGDRWMDIAAKPDILTAISAPISDSGMKPSVSLCIEEVTASDKDNPAVTKEENQTRETDGVNLELSTSPTDEANDGDAGNDVGSFRADDEDPDENGGT